MPPQLESNLRGEEIKHIPAYDPGVSSRGPSWHMHSEISKYFWNAMTSSAVITLGVTFLWMEAGSEPESTNGIRKLGKFASSNLHSLNLS